MEANHLRHGHGEHSVGVGVLQIAFAGKGQLAEIIYAMDVPGSHALPLHQAAVMRHIGPDAGDLPAQPFTLQLLKRPARQGLQLRLIAAVRRLHPLLSLWVSSTRVSTERLST
ncbi:hypothetical protein SDC9_146824 [bioreactor metagenome]|uniref:Uncharacterized protein n=1 Tax=bioreactor metagenome TaxID=1076179 RepID=A0A645EG94_9ZZZZ